MSLVARRRRSSSPLRAATLAVAMLLAVAAPAAAAGTGGAGLGATLPPSPSGGGGLGAAPPAAKAPSAVTTTPAHRSRPVRHAKRRSRGASTPTVAPGQLLITGAGDGHGIGMSQYGAEGYAEHGFTTAQILAHYYSGTSLGQVSPNRIVRVLIGDGSRATFSGARAANGIALSPSQSYAVTVSRGGLELVNAASGRRLAGLSSPVTVTGGGVVDAGGRPYRGSLVLSADGAGGVQTVDVVGLDDYVRGVVAAEMPSSWAPAALRAQAIAARSYAITTEVSGNGYTLYDDTRSQMYGGVDAETAATNAAVAQTAGQVVTYDGAPAVTYFFASSGGHTESIQNAWPGASPEPWLRGVPDPYDGAAGDPYESWHVEMSLAAATADLGSLVRGELQRIVVTRRGVSPRVVSAEVVGTRGTTTVTGGQLEYAFGLDSTWLHFTVG